MKPMTRDERIAAVYAEADRRAAKKRSAYEERQQRGNAGLPRARSVRNGGSIATSSRRRTTGKHNAH